MGQWIAPYMAVSRHGNGDGSGGRDVGRRVGVVRIGGARNCHTIGVEAKAELEDRCIVV